MLGESCPKCGRDRKEKADMKLFITICGHTICDTCTQHRPRIKCPVCGTEMPKQMLVDEDGLDENVTNEVFHRKRILSIYNMEEEDFSNLEEYYSYQEMVEDIIYNYVNKIEFNKVKAQINAYSEEHADDIAARANRKLRREREETMLEERALRNDMLGIDKMKDINLRGDPMVDDDTAAAATAAAPGAGAGGGRVGGWQGLTAAELAGATAAAAGAMGAVQQPSVSMTVKSRGPKRPLTDTELDRCTGYESNTMTVLRAKEEAFSGLREFLSSPAT